MHSMWSGPRYIFIRSEFFINKIKWKIKEEFWNEMEWFHCVYVCVYENGKFSCVTFLNSDSYRMQMIVRKHVTQSEFDYMD